MRNVAWKGVAILSILVFGSPIYASGQALGFGAVADSVKEEKVIESLGKDSALFWSTMRSRTGKTVQELADSWNIVCKDSFEGTAHCYRLLARINAEPELQKAMKIAKILKVVVLAGDKNLYGDGWVEINVESPTKNIMIFLLGDKDAK